MAKKPIKGIQLEQAVKQVLDDYGSKVYAVLDDCVKEVAADAAEKLQSVDKFSPKGHPPGAYSKSWVADRERTGRLKTKYVVHNVEHYRLAHLLEKGHVLHNGTRRVPAYPHIAPVEKWAQDELPKAVKRGLEK